MYMDQPDDVAMNLFMSGLFKGHPIGRPILGTAETVRSFNRGILKGYGGEMYAPGNAILCAAGDVKPAELLALAAECFSCWQGISKEVPSSAPLLDFSPVTEDKKLEQTNIIIGTEGLKFSAAGYYALALLNDILDGCLLYTSPSPRD